jgi:hypothetical protein
MAQKPESPPQVTKATARLTADEIRMCFERIKEYVDRAERLLTRAYEESHWALLGYASWADYCKKELHTDLVRLPVPLRTSIAEKMKALGATTREIAAATGTSQMQASRDTRPETNVSVPTKPVDNTVPEPEPAPRPEPKTRSASRPPKATEEELIAACTAGIEQGRKQGEIGAELGLKSNSMTLARVYAIAKDRLHRPEPSRQPVNWNAEAQHQFLQWFTGHMNDEVQPGIGDAFEAGYAAALNLTEKLSPTG